MDCKPPQQFVVDDVSHWPKWKQRFQIYMLASGKSKETEQVKIAILLNIIGERGLDIYNTFTEETDDTLENCLKKFDHYFLPKRNVTMETFKFNNISQNEDDNIDSFITELKKQAANCEFVCTNNNCKTSYSNRMIKDRVILGLNNKQIQQRLIREPDMSLEKIQEYCKSVELSEKHIKLLSPDEDNINAVTEVFKCRRCDYDHSRGKCPAFNKICVICKKKGHFSKMCFYNKNKTSEKPLPSSKEKKDVIRESGEEMKNGQTDKKIEEIKKSNCNRHNEHVKCINTEVSNDNLIIIGEQKKNTASVSSWYEEISVINNIFRFKLDTGAESSVLPLKYFKKLNIPFSNIVPTSSIILTYGNFKIKIMGEIVLKSIFKNRSCHVKFLIVDTDSEPILGLKDCVAFNIISRINSLNNQMFDEFTLLPEDKKDIYNNFPEIFDGLGCIPGLVDIKLKPDAIPIIQAQRRIPLTLHKKLEITLNDLENKKIISKVDYPTEWVNSPLIVEKPDGSLRLCLDPKPLNKYICREHYPIPKCDDILSRLVNKNIFTVIDMKDGFWQLELNKQSAELCTFSTPFGRYKFNRVPFGISSAPEIFQRKCYQIFGDIPGVEIYFDDIIVSGKTELDHDNALKCVIERALKNGIKFNYNKLQYKLREVNFLGQVISDTGVHPNNKNIEAVLAIETPQNKKDVLRILGLFKFFSKFIPNLSQLTFNMRNLTKNNIQFDWTADHQYELDTLKTLITQKPLLKMFDENKPILIQTDASSKGLGYVLLQDNYPIAFGSRSLSKAEEKYAQIEKELLSIVVACTKFHYLIYGREFIVQTDHKPLISIISKNLDQVSMRLQRLLLKLLKYNIKLEYIPGSNMYIADALSRSFIKIETPIDEDMEYIVHSLSLNVPMTDEKRIVFINAINQDPVLSKVKDFCQNNWPRNIKNLDSELKLYYNLRNNIYLSDNLLFYDTKIIVPNMLRKEMLNLIHETHFGIQKCKLRARQIMFWPKMSSDIENFVDKCEVCQLNKPANTKESLVQHDLPERPWQYLHSDFLEYQNKYYLLIVDSYSHWLEIYPVKDKTANTVIDVCKDIFSKFGIPDIFYADNNPYNSSNFKDFAKQWNFKLEFSSPHHHQSNGIAEKYVDITKRMLKKMKCVQDLPYYLLEYRNTPLPSIGFSPSQLLLNKLVKTKIPICDNNLLPNIIDPKLVKNKFEINREKQQRYYNKNSKDLPPLENNQNVLFQKNNKWEKGKVIEKYNNRSYILKDTNGNTFRRNRKLINKTKIPYKNNYNYNLYDDILDTDINTNVSNFNERLSEKSESQSSEDYETQLRNLFDDDRVEVEIEENLNVENDSDNSMTDATINIPDSDIQTNLRTRSTRESKIPCYLKDFNLY